MRKLLKRIKTDEGITIVELAVAIVLLGIIIVSALPAIILTNQIGQRSAVASDASRWAQTQVEETVFRCAAGGCSTGTTTTSFTPKVKYPSTNTYQATTQITVATGGQSGEIRVRVTEQIAGGASKQLTDIISGYVVS